MTVFLAVFAAVFLAIIAAIAVIFIVAGRPSELEAQETPIADDMPNDFRFDEIVAAQRPNHRRSI